MTDLKRWLDEGAPETVEVLFRAAQREQPPSASVERTVASLGAAATAASASFAAAASQGALSNAATAGATVGGQTAFAMMPLVKWGVIGLASGALLIGGAHGVIGMFMDPPASPANDPAAAAAVAQRSVPHPVAQGPGPEPAGATQLSDQRQQRLEPRIAERIAPRDTELALPPPDSESAVEVGVEQLAQEVQIVDRARAALNAGQPAAALNALAEYDALPVSHRLVPEALYLRMEALLALGQPSGARSAAERLVASYPRAPQTARARVVLSRQNQ